MGNNINIIYLSDGNTLLSSIKTKNDPSTQEFCLDKKLYINEEEVCQQEITLLIFLS